jgi:hypothetical protein
MGHIVCVLLPFSLPLMFRLFEAHQKPLYAVHMNVCMNGNPAKYILTKNDLGTVLLQ